MAKPKDGIASEWIQVRLRRKTAEKLRQFSERLRRYCCENPGLVPAWLDDSSDRPVSFDAAILTLIWRDDCHSARSRVKGRTKATGIAD